MFKKIVNIAALLVVVASAFMVSSGTPTRAQAKKLKIAFSVPSLEFPFFVHMVKQAQDEAARIGDITIDILDGQNKTDKQNADLESTVVNKYDGVVVSPLASDATAPAVQEVVDAKIPIVTIDREVTGVNTLAHVGADNVKGGELQGQLIMKMFPKGAKIFNLQGQPGTSPAIARNKGLHNALDGKADYKIVVEQTGNFKREDGLKVVEAALAANEPPDVIVAANDEMAFGAIEALKAANLTGKVAVIGFDALPEALLAVKNGTLTGTVEQQPGGQTRGALKVIVDYLRNNTKPAQHDNYLTPIMITKDNLKDAERLGEIEAPSTATMAATIAATAAK